jgi:hypothetical protein
MDLRRCDIAYLYTLLSSSPSIPNLFSRGVTAFKPKKGRGDPIPRQTKYCTMRSAEEKEVFLAGPIITVFYGLYYLNCIR